MAQFLLWIVFKENERGIAQTPNKWNDFLLVSPWSQLAAGFGRAALYPLLDHIHITMFVTWGSQSLSVHTLSTSEQGMGPRTSEEIQVFLLFIHSCNFFWQGECRIEQADHKRDTDSHKAF